MELHTWATRILAADTIEDKLYAPDRLTDEAPGASFIWDAPTRPPGMHFQKRKKSEKLPSLNALHDAEKRALCLHRFAGHELLAVEIMAFTLLACPDAPKHFRKGLANTLKEEQEHVRLYMQAMKRFGVQFGDFPLYRHFWAHTRYIRSPLQYVSTMCLTLEMANLDFAPIYGKAFALHGDDESSQLMQRIFDDEIAHVAFGYNWLKKWKPAEKEAYAMWTESLSPLMKPSRACGPTYHPEHRRLAGIDENWIAQLDRIT